jgi:hypothetical protein
MTKDYNPYNRYIFVARDKKIGNRNLRHIFLLHNIWCLDAEGICPQLKVRLSQWQVGEHHQTMSWPDLARPWK